MAKVNHARRNASDLIRQRGTDRINDYGIPLKFRSTPRQQPSKADLRRKLEQATASITRLIKCHCGHSASVVIPPSRMNARLRCSKCSAVVTDYRNENVARREPDDVHETTADAETTKLGEPQDAR